MNHCEFCDSTRGVKLYTLRLEQEEAPLCIVCSRLLGIEYRLTQGISNKDLLYAIVQLFHALNTEPLDEE